MVDLLIRNLPPETHKALKKLAAERDTTLGEAARDLLVRGTDTAPKRPLSEVLAELQQQRATRPPVRGFDADDLSWRASRELDARDDARRGDWSQPTVKRSGVADE